MKASIGLGIALFAGLLVFAWFHENAVQHINLLVSVVGIIVIPLLIWQFGSVRAEAKRETTAKEVTLNLVLLDIEYLSQNALELSSQLERILGDFDRFKNYYPKLSAENADLNEFSLILASTRSLPKFRYEFGFSKKDLQVFSKDGFRLFDLVFQLLNTVGELNENLAALNDNFKNALAEIDKKYDLDDAAYERYAFVNDSYKGVFSEILATSQNLPPKIDGEILPEILGYAGKNFDANLFSYYGDVADRIRKFIEASK